MIILVLKVYICVLVVQKCMNRNKNFPIETYTVTTQNNLPRTSGNNISVSYRSNNEFVTREIRQNSNPENKSTAKIRPRIFKSRVKIFEKF